MRPAHPSRPDSSRPGSQVAGLGVAPGRALTVGGAAALLVVAVFFGGGSGDGRVLWVGGIATLLAGALLAGASLGLVPFPRLARDGTVAVAAFTGLVIWIGVSIAWSVAGDLSWSELNKGIGYAAALAVGVGLAASGRSTTRAVAGLLALVLGAALVWALIGKAIPAVAPGDALTVARLHGTVGYWNALALLADASSALGVWLAVGSAGRHVAVRAAGAALLYVAVLAGLLTTSRAGVLGGLLAVAVWLWLGERRVLSASTAVVALAPAAAVAAWTYTRPALVEVGHPHAARVHDGAVFGALAAIGLAVAVCGCLAVPRLIAGRERVVGRALAAGAVLALAAAVVAVAIAAGNPVTKVRHGFSSECTNTAGRFTCTNTNRLRWWREAARIFVARPLGGAGAGTFGVVRKRYRTSGEPVTEPHSVPMQVLAGTGVVGGLLLVAVGAGVLLAIRRALRSLAGPERAAAVALTAFPAAYALHALVDYDADFVSVTVPVLLTTGTLLGAGRPVARGRPGLVPALGVAALAATALVTLALPWLAARKVNASYDASSAGHAQQAIDDARSARSLNPLSADALYALAAGYETGGDLGGARAAFTRATTLQPENPETWYLLGLFEFLQTRDMCAAYYALNTSYTLDPKGTFWVRGGPLDRARDAVNHGACKR